MESSGGQSSTPHLNSPEEEINAYLKVKKQVAMKVKKSETVKNLKAVIQKKEGISEDIEDLFYPREKLTNGKLIDYGIESNSTLQRTSQIPSELELFVKLTINDIDTGAEVKDHHSVQNIKSSIHVKEGIQSDQFNLVHDGNLLDEDMKLASLNIKSDSVLQLGFCPREVLSISVKAPTGDIVKLKAKVLFTVGDVKVMVGSITGVSASNQIMSYAGKVLEDSKTLAFYDIKEGCMLEMLPSLIQIFVKTLTEEIVKLKVKVLLTVCDVKAIVANMMGVSVVDLDLFYAGIKLADLKTLACYNIKDDYLLEAFPASFQIFVKSWSGETITLDVKLCKTIKDVKDKLFLKLQIPPYRQCVIFAGKRLEDNQDLASYNIEKNSTLHMVFAPTPSSSIAFNKR